MLQMYEEAMSLCAGLAAANRAGASSVAVWMLRCLEIRSKGESPGVSMQLAPLLRPEAAKRSAASAPW